MGILPLGHVKIRLVADPLSLELAGPQAIERTVDELTHVDLIQGVVESGVGASIAQVMSLVNSHSP